jgi:hypothetical protein
MIPAMSNDDPPAARRGLRRLAATRRLAGLQATLLAAAALSLGLTASQLQLRQRTQPVRQIAAERGVDVAALQNAVLTAATPLLDEAVRNGALSQEERDSLAWRIRARITSA